MGGEALAREACVVVRVGGRVGVAVGGGGGGIVVAAASSSRSLSTKARQKRYLEMAAVSGKLKIIKRECCDQPQRHRFCSAR